MYRILMFAAAIMLVGIWQADSVSAYQEASVTDGGTVSGKITYKGTPPEPEHFRVVKNPEFCGEERDFYHIAVKKGVLLNAIVVIEGVEKGKPMASQTMSMVGQNCAFLPYTGAVEKKGKGKKNRPVLEVLNEDTVIHNPHPFEMIGAGRRSLWNIGLPEKGDKLSKGLRVKRGNVVKLQCDQHDFMHAWIRVTTNPYWVLVGKDGSYNIDQVPPGKYTLVAWHPILGEQKKDITVGAKGTVKASFEFSGAGTGR